MFESSNGGSRVLTGGWGLPDTYGTSEHLTLDAGFYVFLGGATVSVIAALVMVVTSFRGTRLGTNRPGIPSETDFIALARSSWRTYAIAARSLSQFRRDKRQGIVAPRKLPMGTSDQPSRSKLLAWLGGFVVVFGAAAWVVTGGIRFHVAPPTHAKSTFPPPANTPVVDCPSNQLMVAGIYDECATAAPAKTSTCDVYGRMLDEVLRFTGDHQAFALEIQIDGSYAGLGTYDLPSWPHRLGTQDGVPKVAMFAIGVFWQSITGVVTVTSSNGRSGTVNAILQTSNGTTVVPGTTINVIGRWSCA